MDAVKPLIKEILSMKPEGQRVTVRGWVRTKRETKTLVFLQISDGSCLAPMQVTFRQAEAGQEDGDGLFATLRRISTGASVMAEGALVESPAKGQAVEVQGEAVRIIGEAPAASYPLQKKNHTFEFLRTIAHLRSRTNTFGAVARMRSQMAFAVHSFFQARGFQYIHTPIITASDCEGAGEMFRVTTLDPQRVAQEAYDAGKEGRPLGEAFGGWAGDFFGRHASLTVSGQLEAETYALGVSRVYTFGPTFRAENSNTARHLAEFWMIEPEMAFFDLNDNMDLAETFVKHLIGWALENCREDMDFFNLRIQPGLIGMLEKVASSAFARATYTEAVRELERAKADFEFEPFWGCDLQSEHEKFLTEEVFGSPVILTDYPKEIKAFYMKLNDDEKTVRAMDVLVPGLGEIIGGSEREERLGCLEQRIRELGLNPDDYWWYLDLRRFGTVPHSGFGLGFERLLLYITGMANIRDVIPYPRAPKLADF